MALAYFTIWHSRFGTRTQRATYLKMVLCALWFTCSQKLKHHQLTEKAWHMSILETKQNKNKNKILFFSFSLFLLMCLGQLSMSRNDNDVHHYFVSTLQWICVCCCCVIRAQTRQRKQIQIGSEKNKFIVNDKYVITQKFPLLSSQIFFGGDETRSGYVQ